MKYLNKLIGGNVLLKVTSMNSIGVMVQMVCGLAISKALAIFVGPQGLTLIGNLRNLLYPLQQIGILGMYNGVVKYTAEFKDNEPELRKIFSTSFFIGAIVTIVLAFLVYFNANFINNLYFPQEDFSNVIRVLACALPLYSLNLYCLAILNGFSKYKLYIILNIITNILGMFITLFLVWRHGLEGALYGVVIIPAINLLITLILILNHRSFVGFLSIASISKKYIKNLSSFALMQLVSAILIPVVMTAIRLEIVDVESTTQAGYWEAIHRLSGYYMMFFTTLMTVYVLPKLSSVTSNKEFRDEIINFYKTVLPFFAIGILIIYFMKIIVIKVVFTSEFMPMQSLFGWQLLGDLFKIMSVVIAYQFLAKNMFWSYIITEFISIAIIYLSSMYLIGEHGFIGASMAHFFSYVCYLIVVLFFFRKALFGIKV